MENHVIRAIKTEEQYKAILKQIRQLWTCAENSPEADLLEVLSILADDYENKHYPIAPPDPIEAIKYKMEENGLSANDLIPYFGSRSRVSEVLNRKNSPNIYYGEKVIQRIKYPSRNIAFVLRKCVTSIIHFSDKYCHDLPCYAYLC